jgi:hypothetical protein
VILTLATRVMGFLMDGSEGVENASRRTGPYRLYSKAFCRVLHELDMWSNVMDEMEDFVALNAQGGQAANNGAEEVMVSDDGYHKDDESSAYFSKAVHYDNAIANKDNIKDKEGEEEEVF